MRKVGLISLIIFWSVIFCPNISHAKETFDVKSEKIGPFSIGADAKLIVKILGNPDEKSKFFNRVNSGAAAQTWIYKRAGISFQINKEKNLEKIINIKIYSPCKYKTLKGIGIGSHFNEVSKSYSKYVWDNMFCDGDNIIVGEASKGLAVKMKNGFVISMFLGERVLVGNEKK